MCFYVAIGRAESLSYQERSLLSDCNLGCSCTRREWDPVCGENGISYVSPCLAGCALSTGSGKNTVRHTTLFMFFISLSLLLIDVCFNTKQCKAHILTYSLT